MNRGALLLLVVLAELLPAMHSPAVAARPAPALEQQQPGPEPPLLKGDPAPKLRGELVMRTYSLDFYRLPGGLEAESIRALAMLAETSIVSDTEVIGSGLRGRVSIRFEPPQQGACAIRGLTLSSQRTIRLFYAPGTDTRRIVAILSHELAHQLQHDYYGTSAHRRADTILLEGMATWISRAYFSDPDGRPRYQREVAQALERAELLPLRTDLEVDCRTATRNTIYDQWASFVEYLVERYGRERLDKVYRAGSGREPGSAAYREVYGVSFATLETGWRAWLGRRQPDS
jgi:hypothetical protein